MAYSNSFASQTHGTTITNSSSASDGTSLQTTAGTQTIPFVGDKSHFGMSGRIGAVAAGQTRPIVMALGNTATSGAGSIEFMLSGWPGTISCVIANFEANGGGMPAALLITTAGKAAFSRNGGTIIKTTTASLQPFTPYRLDMSVTGMGTTSATIHMAICAPGSAPFTAISSDFDATATAVDLSSTTYATLKSLQFGFVQGQGGATTGTLPDVWWWAPRVDEGTTTPVVGWVAAAPIGTAKRAVGVTVTAGSATAAGTRSGDSTAINSADLAGALGDGDSATTITTAAGTSQTIDYGRMVLSGDLTLSFDIQGGSGTVQLMIDGVAQGSAKTLASSVTFTQAEQGNPAANSEHRVGAVVAG